MNIILAKSAGFCFGVGRAVNAVYDNIKKSNMPIYTYGSIIHNNQVVDELQSKGVKIIEDIEELQNIKDGIIIIRSHGVPPQIYKIIEDNELLSIDMTCPYVKKIHKIVEEHYDKGYQIIIIGKDSHPEVIGINGYCNNSAIIIDSLDDCFKLDSFDKVCVVAQTTFSLEKWEEISNFITLNKCKEHVSFNTICNSTSERQKETLEISKKVNAMITVGSKHSSNTQKLFNISNENCTNCYYIETVDELDIQEMAQYDSIGVTAGASTPKSIVDEVINALKKIDNTDKISIESANSELSDNENEDSEDFDFEKELDESFKKITIGDIVDGEVVFIRADEVIVNFGYKSDGIISLSEFLDNEVKIGDRIRASVVDRNDDGNMILSKKHIDIEKAWEKAKIANENNSIILVKVLEQIKGGMLGSFEGVRVFIPMSQLSNKYVDDANEYINTVIPAKIIEFDDDKNNIVVSSRIVIEESNEAAKKDFWSGIHIGKEFVGKVVDVANYGAFIDIGGVTGLLHISEISHNKSDSIEKYLKINDSVEVYIKELDREKEKISLALKNRPKSPWAKISDKYSEGDVIEGIVTKLMPYGAFVEIESGIDGLVHISQISDKNLNKPDEMLEVSQKVKAKILSIDVPNRRISLSIKDVAPINEKGESNLEIDESQKSYSEEFEVTLGDIFKNLK